MSNQSFYLFQLQKIDRRSDQILARISAIDAELGNQDAWTEASSRHNSSLKVLKELTDRLGELEKKSTEKQLKVEISESSLYGGKVKNPKELTDLQHEIGSLKSSLDQLENEQLELMMLIEDQQVKVSEAEKALAAASSTQDASHRQLSEEKQGLAAEIARLKVERDALLPQVKPESLLLYDSLRKSKKGIAVAGVEDQCCTICGSQLTPAEVQQAKYSAQILYCPSCGRILYVD